MDDKFTVVFNQHIMKKVLIGSFLAGAAALIYQMVSLRYMSLILGSEAYAVAVTIGCYMVGLSVGSILFGIFADKNQRLATTLSIMGFVLFCGLSPLMYRFINDFAHSDSLSMRVLTCFLFMLPATVCAGGVIPNLIKIGGHLKSPASIYAANTFGSIAGVLLCGYWLIKMLGLSATALSAACLALFCFVMMLFVRNRNPKKTKTAKVNKIAANPPKYSKTLIVAVIAVYCVSGFASMTFEVFQTKVLTLFFRDSVYDFTVILTVYLIGLFIGNVCGGRFAAKKDNLLFYFSLTQILAGTLVIFGLYIVNMMPVITADVASGMTMFERYGADSFFMSNVLKFGYSALTILLPACLWGMGFPLVNKITIAGEKNVGKITGITVGLNTFLCSAGTMLSAFYLVNVLGIRGTIMLSGIICPVFGVALAGIGYKSHIRTVGKPKYMLPAVVVLAAILWLFLPGWDKLEMSSSFLKPGQNVKGAYKILFYKEDAYGITGVVDFFPTGQKFLTTNRRYCQNTSDLYGPEDHQRLGILPLLIHQNPKNVLAIGLGAGITLRGANEFPNVNIDCVEISKSVVEAARCFGEENNRVLDKKNVHIITDDGRNYIKNTNKSYDVIIADIFFPGSSGSSNVFSRDYYEMCKKRLNPGGIMAQWIPVHQFSTEELNITIKTFVSVFKTGRLWFGLIGTSVPVIGIIGSDKDAMIDGLRLSELYGNPNLQNILSEIALDDMYMLLSHFIANIKDVPLADNIPINTDDRPILEYLNPKMEINTPGYQRAAENMRYASYLKMTAPQNGYYINADENIMKEYNMEILNYVHGVFSEYGY